MMVTVWCDYCEAHDVFPGGRIKYCNRCGKWFCPRCARRLPQRGVNAFREKVFGKHTGRYR